MKTVYWSYFLRLSIILISIPSGIMKQYDDAKFNDNLVSWQYIYCHNTASVHFHNCIFQSLLQCLKCLHRVINKLEAFGIEPLDVNMYLVCLLRELQILIEVSGATHHCSLITLLNTFRKYFSTFDAEEKKRFVEIYKVSYRVKV